ncbi:MAG: hypothetical protein ACR2PZ_16115 [Pseudomonadales bacterium]
MNLKQHSGTSSWLAGLAGALLCTTAQAAQDDMITAYLAAGTLQSESEYMQRLPDAAVTSWLDDSELRVTPEVDSDSLWTQTYSVRARPIGRKERVANRRLSRLDNQMIMIEMQQSQNELLADRYHQLLDLAALEVISALSERSKRLDETELAQQRLLSARAAGNSNRLQRAVLDLELRESTVAQETAHLKSLRATTVGNLLAVAEDPRGLSDRLLSPALIERRVQQIKDARDIRVQHRQLELDRAQEQLAITKAQRGFGLSLLELSFENKGIDSYNMTVGFRLPALRGSAELSRRAREIIRAEQQAFLAQQLASSQWLRHKQAVQRLHLQFEIGQRAYGQSTQRRGAGTLDAQAQMLQVRHELMLVESMVTAHVGMARELVDLLAQWGRLDDLPVRNWLGADR